MTTTTTTYAVCVGVADIRRDPDPNAELVTQALMNVEVTAGETEGEWTHVALTDYTGWISSNQLEEPVVKGFCKIGEPGLQYAQLCSLWFAVVSLPDAPPGRAPGQFDVCNE